VNEPHLTIGAFSRAGLLSIKMLRAYHEAGILIPAGVDPRTGYRAYHPTQLIDAAVIRRLRALDVPLDQVRRVVTARDPDVTRQVLAEHTKVMRERLEDTARIVAELQDDEERPSAYTPVHVRDEPAAHTLAVRGTVREDGFAAFLGSAYQALHEITERLGPMLSGPSGALYPPEIADDAMEVEAYLPLAAPVSLPADRGPVVLSQVPAARVAVVVHTGAYDTIDGAYRRLGAWVAEHAEPGTGPVREVYLVSWDQTPDPARFRTEIQWPVG
jgi:DNA-binding transcriptional MerR regulator